MTTQMVLEGSCTNVCLHELNELVFFILHIHLGLYVSYYSYLCHRRNKFILLHYIIKRGYFSTSYLVILGTIAQL